MILPRLERLNGKSRSTCKYRENKAGQPSFQNLIKIKTGFKVKKKIEDE
jgi:hypothetical protein